jgi:hypothetical protein
MHGKRPNAPNMKDEESVMWFFQVISQISGDYSRRFKGYFDSGE